MKSAPFFIAASLLLLLTLISAPAKSAETPTETKVAQSANQEQPKRKEKKKRPPRLVDAKNKPSGIAEPKRDPAFAQYGIYAKTAPRPKATAAVDTSLPLKLKQGDRIALIGNTLLDRAQLFGQFESVLQKGHADLELVVRNLAWSADTADLQPRPANFADMDQHLTHEKADVVIAAFGFNESFAGEAGLPEFEASLTKFVAAMKTKAYNGKSAPRIILVSPIANENVAGVAAADMNNDNIRQYGKAIEKVAAEQKVGYANVFDATLAAAASPDSDITINGSHLTHAGYGVFADALYKQLFDKQAPAIDESLRLAVVDKNNQFFRRYRPANTFYYTGDRSKSYGYLDFLPAMRNFDVMTANRDERIWALAKGKEVPAKIDDSNVPPLPATKQSRGANEWITAAEELKAFKIDPRFEVNLFAGEEQFPELGAPIQMRWDSQGRLWVSCSTTYPHVYPGNEPNDKLVILEDTDGDGRADKSSVFADDLHIPLSFEFGDGGVYVSEMPHLTFIKDTDGDGKADLRRVVLSGFGTEDSHHALHDFAWTPDGDLIFRESIFHHSQVETPYGPVRQANSGWFRYEPRTQRLTSFGTYHSTNPWGVTFDDWGQHMASHPIFASAHHALDPPYPMQHPKPSGLQAYSGVCGQEFIDFASFPADMQGQFIKVRYKPTNRVEILKWKEGEFGYTEEYVSDLIFSTNLSFIPVDLRYGPRGAMYVCDWYNPIKGHAQYSLRDERRDRHSGRIWRITAKDHKLIDPPQIAGASIESLLDILKRPEYRYRYWAKRELRERNADEVKAALDKWVQRLDPRDDRFRHHQVEAIWAYRNIDRSNLPLFREVFTCENHHARAAATRQLRYWHSQLDDDIDLLRTACNDSSGLVRLEAAIAASYIGSKEALDALLDVFKHPRDGHLAYAITCALGSHTLRQHWEGNPDYDIARRLKKASRESQIKEPPPTAKEAAFDTQKNLKLVKISCIPERMLFTVRQFTATTGQPIKLVFANPDATDHNLVIVKPGALEEVGMAANEMAKDPKNANSDFIPAEKKSLILHASPMIGPMRKTRIHVLRFTAPTAPGIYPYVCTFPGHWVVMKGEIVVADTLADIDKVLASRKEPAVINEWTLPELSGVVEAMKTDETTVMRGMQSFMKARCHQCHVVNGHGVNLGPDLQEAVKRYQGEKLLRQIVQPSHEINKKYQTFQIETVKGKVINGVIVKEDESNIHVMTNLLTPDVIEVVAKKDIDFKTASKISSMPEGLLNVLTKAEIADLMSFLQTGGYKLPKHLEGKHGHGHGAKP